MIVSLTFLGIALLLLYDLASMLYSVFSEKISRAIDRVTEYLIPLQDESEEEVEVSDQEVDDR